jgi:tRNA-dihydrouridine synthase
LLADFGGCGAVWTEMLAARQLLNENFATSPWVRRRPQDGSIVFQLMVRPGDPMQRILDRLRSHDVDAVDLNLACDSPFIRAQAAGRVLFERREELRILVGEARQHWPGLLTAKIRLGTEGPNWQTDFADRLQLLEAAGIDAVTVHPRLFEDKFRRRARLELFPWIASLTKLPIIANGDLLSRTQVLEQADHLRPTCAVMFGRVAITRPWIFAAWNQPVRVDHAEIWQTMSRYIVEDFTPLVALRRIKMFTKYYAANFAFGHPFYMTVFNAPSLDAVRQVAATFFSRDPKLVSSSRLPADDSSIECSN